MVRGMLRFPMPQTSSVAVSTFFTVKRFTSALCPQSGQKLPSNSVPQLRQRRCGALGALDTAAEAFGASEGAVRFIREVFYKLRDKEHSRGVL